MQDLQRRTQLIPTDTPYSIVICECAYPTPYRVEGLPTGKDPEYLDYGALEECDALFDKLKKHLIESGYYVVEVGCCVTRTQVPRQMLVNYTPYDVWKAIYRNLNVQDQVLIGDRILTEGRKGRKRYPVFSARNLLENRG